MGLRVGFVGEERGGCRADFSAPLGLALLAFVARKDEFTVLTVSRVF